MIPDPPPLELIREAQQIIERIAADPKNAVWSDAELRHLRYAWEKWIRDPEDPVPWRIAREFFSARYKLKAAIRAAHCNERVNDVTAALGLILEYLEIDHSQVLDALQSANQLRLSLWGRCRPPWTRHEMRVIAAAREFIVEHREQVTKEMEDQFHRMIWGITRVGEMYLDHSVWQIACEMMDIDLSEDAIEERGGWTRN